MAADDRFWELSNGNPCFAAWLQKVDKLCMRFLDIDLLSIPEAMEEPYFPDHSFEEEMEPMKYFLWLLESMKQGSPEDGINIQVARMIKWGVQWPPISA
jgi:hypothetical protein